MRYFLGIGIGIFWQSMEFDWMIWIYGKSRKEELGVGLGFEGFEGFGGFEGLWVWRVWGVCGGFEGFGGCGGFVGLGGWVDGWMGFWRIGDEG